MAIIYDFQANCTLRLLRAVSRQVVDAKEEIASCQACLEDVTARFEDNIKSLRHISQGLYDEQKSCDRVKAISDRCQQIMENGDIDQMVEYMDNLTKSRRHKQP